MFALPETVQLRDVCARDGLQGEAPLTVVQRVQLIESILAAGVTHIEIAAFVSPKAVPAMADAADVVATLGGREGVVRTALVPNLRGAIMATDSGVEELTVTISASAVYNQRNVQMTIDESTREIERICSIPSVPPVDAVLSCAFGAPYEGDIDPSEIGRLCGRLYDVGVTRVTLADTTGMATPRRIHDVLDVTGVEVGLHLHETRGTGLVNAYAALLAGVCRFDCSVGGLGGSPYATGAAGNLATEDLVALLDDMGVQSGIKVDALIDAALLAESLVGHAVPSRVAHTGPRSRRSA